MSEYTCKIERAANGFEVELADPKIVARNKQKGQYNNPQVTYVFRTVAEVLAFLTKTLETALPMGEYDATFSKALEESDDDD